MFRKHIYLAITITISTFLALSPSGAAASDNPERTDIAKSPKKLSKLVDQTKEPNSALRGIDIAGMKLIEGRYREKLDDGRLVTFTVDPKLQAYADELLKEYDVPAGAAVILNSRTGRVLAMSQRRELNNFANIPEVALDPSFPAASLFKIITAAALLEKSTVSANTTTCYAGGSSRLVMENLLDPPEGKGACVSLKAAFGRSINAVFAKLADRNLNRDIIEQYADRFGFNSKLPFDIPLNESVADIPGDRLELARTAAGFWHSRLSPLHAAVIAQILAQKGVLLRPYIVDTVEDNKGTLLHKSSTKYLGHAVSSSTADALMDIMTATVSSGTARRAFKDRKGTSYLPGVEVAGKTGTLNGKDPFRAYTWFVGAAPVNNPEVAIAVLIVNEPKWKIKASNAAALLLKKYFENKEAKTANTTE